jgi:hypothetical protein
LRTEQTNSEQFFAAKKLHTGRLVASGDCTTLEVELKSYYILQSTAENFKTYLLAQV